MGTALALGFVVAAAIAVEAVVGFGATVLTLAFGLWLLPITELLPAYVPVNMLLSASIVWRDRRALDLRVLLRRVLPLTGAGLVVGMGLYRWAARPSVQVAFGVVVVALGVRELAGVLRRAAAVAAPKPWHGAALMLSGGVVYGLFGTGGVLIVAALAGEGLDKDRSRATLAALWLLLNAALLVNFARHGSLGAASFARSATLVPAMIGGAVVGEVLHRRVAARPFRIATAVMMIGAGAAAIARI